MTTSGATNFLVEGMNCGKCAARVTKAIQAQAPHAQVEVDLASKRVSVTPASPDPEALAQAITEAGYPARPAA
ncbi:copper chaperone [Rhodoblastus acidophilus]|uniref:Copper chaperone n=1 Tax=Rhodoblastus acidophilus TaxID=1074 RepID=A0A212RHW4_RHOAC|nr:heavy-metal-associated domain-containing protein [Rhodoblastus acidophilus]MCW2317011.1 copper chaperone CopZ [Rhodoblastus acidophilus]PPQ38057.1 copper chaperone [Rhodoblastus acidophilus]RAI18428.1 copper chaperone [Rhodoblastus acidophilus]SNB72017.1 copper chaperone [Rhodoblastus acidophilus]